MSISFVIVGIFAAVGAVFAAAGFVMENQQRALLRDGVKATVEVVDLETYRGSEGRQMYKPVFEIVSGPYSGERYTSSSGSRPAPYSVGHRGEGRYDATSGRIGMADGRQLRFAIAFSSLGLGLIGGLGIYLFRAAGL